MTLNKTKKVTKAKRFDLKISAWHLAVPWRAQASWCAWCWMKRALGGEILWASGGRDGSCTTPEALTKLCWMDPVAPGTWISTRNHPCVLQVRDRWALASGLRLGFSWRIAAWLWSPDSSRDPLCCPCLHPTPASRPVTSVSILAQNFLG